MNAFKTLIKPFKAPQGSVKKKLTFSLRPGSRREGLSFMKERPMQYLKYFLIYRSSTFMKMVLYIVI